ncbi:hypothetical protein MJ575_28010 [Klebsiella pneumoniae]|nr:hypothetical protein MJ575_28010 [Klebsiella pneumoniae]
MQLVSTGLLRGAGRGGERCPRVQPHRAATSAAPIVVGEPTATLAEPTAWRAGRERAAAGGEAERRLSTAPPPGSIALRGSRPGRVGRPRCAATSWSPTRCPTEYTPSPSLPPAAAAVEGLS